ncbi:hypothetical protein FBD94_05175 [Pedobacter hiemivivus]|nr:hypothetical protein [Pedobacter hiemivivus]TKC63741.1 hypothetical protein FBD94_05175 [Pedobacter hiemivivus]
MNKEELFQVLCGPDIDFAEDFTPISITKDWLVNKFRFNDNGGGYYQHPEYNFFLYHIEEDEYFECYKQVPANDDSGDYKTLQHVHKLQNLFFELFDEELEVRE